MYARDRFPDTKKAVFQSRAMLGRYCNGVGSKNSNDAPRARRNASLNLWVANSQLQRFLAIIARPLQMDERDPLGGKDGQENDK